MRFNLNNPAFLQGASNRAVEPFVSMSFSISDPSLILTGEKICVITNKDGSIIRETYSNLSDQKITFSSDPNTEIVIEGKLTKIKAGNGPFLTEYLTSINLEGATLLEQLNLKQSKITSLNIEPAIALKTLSFSSKMEEFVVKSNSLENLYINGYGSNENLTTLDLSDALNLKVLSIDSNILNLTRIYARAINDGVVDGFRNFFALTPTSGRADTGVLYLHDGDVLNQELISIVNATDWRYEVIS